MGTHGGQIGSLVHEVNPSSLMHRWTSGRVCPGAEGLKPAVHQPG